MSDPSALHIAQALDPVVTFRQQGHVPDDWQVKALRNTTLRQAILAARQVGKGEILTTRVLHRAAFYPGSQIAILTPSLRQSCRLLRRVRRALPSVPHVKATNRAVESLTLSNDSEIVAWPGNRPDLIRGDTLDLLVGDEAAWILEEAFLVALPMLGMSNGTALLASTPGGPDGLLFDLFNDPADRGAGWSTSIATANDCPRYTPEAKAELRRALGESGYAVEMMCEWREGGGSVWSAAEIAAMLGLDCDPTDTEATDDEWADLLANLPTADDLLRSVS